MANVTLRLSIGNFSVEVSGPTKYAEKKLEELIAKYLSSSIKSGTFILARLTFLHSNRPLGRKSPHPLKS